jgi:catechol 2,3-dioxygenase-like lactoylglutathione lyase family enzyme
MMQPRPIEHIGILVPDLEEAIDRWSRATGYTFSPIARYTTPRWTDHSDAEPHHHDARISFSLQGPPRIELMEVSGAGTHGPLQLGVHHFGFQNVASPEDARDELADMGISSDGCSLDPEGRLLLFFSDRDDLDGIRLEMISPLPGPIFADDGSDLPRDPVTGKADIWAGKRPN